MESAEEFIFLISFLG